MITFKISLVSNKGFKSFSLFFTRTFEKNVFLSQTVCKKNKKYN